MLLLLRACHRQVQTIKKYSHAQKFQKLCFLPYINWTRAISIREKNILYVEVCLWWKTDIKKVKIIGPDKYYYYMHVPLFIIFYQLLVLENSFNEFPLNSSNDLKSKYGYIYPFLTVSSRKLIIEHQWFITQ